MGLRVRFACGSAGQEKQAGKIPPRSFSCRPRRCCGRRSMEAAAPGMPEIQAT
jgi:hypothetical protein